MDLSDPQYLFMILILPSLFGLTLIGEGLHKVIKSDLAGWLSLFFGFLFLGLVLFAYFFLKQAAL